MFYYRIIENITKNNAQNLFFDSLYFVFVCFRPTIKKRVSCIPSNEQQVNDLLKTLGIT